MRRLLWVGIIGLAALGVVAGIARSVFVGDLTKRVDVYRTRAFAAASIPDPFAGIRPAEIEIVDGRFGRNPGATLLHVLPGALFLALAPFQFNRKIRRRNVTFHRWSGRVLIVAGMISAVAGLYFGVFMPYAGIYESALVVAVGALLFTSLTMAYAAIRRRDIDRHREWMIRAFAAALGIATVRVVAIVLDVTLTPASFTPKAIFIFSIWIGWLSTIFAAELWVRRTRGLVYSGDYVNTTR